MQENVTNVTLARIITGLGVIGLGVMALLGSLHVINFGDFVSSNWPLAIVFAGVVTILANPRSWLWGTIIALLGVSAYLEVNQYLGIDTWSLVWPVIFLVIGATIVVRAFQPQVGRIEKHLDRTDQFALLSGSELRVASGSYKGGKATAILGGISLDLSATTIDKQAVLDVFTVCGGIEVKVPAGVIVRSKAATILGGIEVKADPHPPKNAPVLLITGITALGGVEVKY